MKITNDQLTYLEDGTVAIETVCKKEVHYILIDKIDVPKVLGISVYVRYKGKKTKVPYAMVALGKRHAREYLHLHILGKPPKGYVTDHKNGDPLDNRRSNFRICSRGENNRNQRKTDNKTTSKYKGVVFWKGAWMGQICFESERHYLGRFDTEEKAAMEYNKAAIKYHGEFAKLNEI